MFRLPALAGTDQGMRTRFLALVTVSFLAFWAAATTLAETTVNQTFPFMATAYNECTDEFIAVEGNLHMTTRLHTSGDRLHFGMTEHMTGVKGTAMGSGARYTMMDVVNTQSNSTGFAPSESTFERTHNLTRLGEDGSFVPGDDLRVHTIVHITMNANGVVTADKSEARVDCR